MKQYLREAEERRNNKKQELVDCLLEGKSLKVEVKDIITRIDQFEKLISQNLLHTNAFAKR